jgi:hypothetical protein
MREYTRHETRCHMRGQARYDTRAERIRHTRDQMRDET